MGYYFLHHLKDETSVTYYTFPNNLCFISIMENVEILYAENAALIKEKEEISLISNLICAYKKPIKISYLGDVAEITISFKPLGLNAFLEKPLSNYTNNFFSDFYPFDDYSETFSAILIEENLEKNCELIENYLLSKLIGFQHPFLNELSDDLKNIEANYTISELAKKYNTSRQNLTKHFELHLCKTPSDF